MRRIKRTGRGDQRHARAGFALLGALLISLLLSAIGTGFAVETRTAGILARNEIDTAQARAVADAGIRYAVSRLLEMDRNTATDKGPLDETALLLDGTPFPWTFAGARVQLSLQAESGKIDINTTKPALLHRLFRAAGLDDKEANALARNISIYRQTDGVIAEADALPAAENEPLILRMSWEMDDKAFDSVDELLRVPGMSRSLFETVAPALTVHGGGRIDITTAPVLALMALEENPQARASAEFSRPVTGESGAAYTITAHAELENGARFTRSALVEITAKDRRSYKIHAWRRTFE